jgi:hypothetical protein
MIFSESRYTLFRIRLWSKFEHLDVGRDPINLERRADASFGVHNGLTSDVASCPLN